MSDEISRNFGINVRDLRKKSGMSLRELGVKVGMTPAGIGNIERGDSVPSLISALKISNGLGVNLYELVGKGFGKNKKEVTLVSLQSRFGKIEKLGRKHRAIISDVVDAFLGS